MAKFKIINEEEVVFQGFEGFHYPENKVEFTFNVAPDEEEINSKEELVKYLDDQIKYLQKCKRFVKALDQVSLIDLDFYWSEGDLNVRIETTMQ